MTRFCMIRRVNYSPFIWPDAPERFAREGIEAVDRPADADVLVCNRWKPLIPHALRWGGRKGYLIWASETRHHRGLAPEERRLLGRARVRIMNAVNGEVFFNEAYFFGMLCIPVGHTVPFVTPADRPDFDERSIIAILGYRQPGSTPCVIGGVDYDLNPVRMDLALRGARAGRIDLYGKGFPDGLSRGSADNQARTHTGVPDDYDGPTDQRHPLKLHLLRKYPFNLCLENTDYGYYITEKIWQSILCRCLPIYYSRHNRIYDFFPADSFINAADFDGYDDLIRFIDRMDVETWCERLNRCIEVFNRISRREAQSPNTRSEKFDRLVRALREANPGYRAGSHASLPVP